MTHTNLPVMPVEHTWLASSGGPAPERLDVDVTLPANYLTAATDGPSMLLDMLFDRAPVGFALLDRDLRYVRVNSTLAETNGLTPQEQQGRTVHELVPLVPSSLVAGLQGVLDAGIPLYNQEMTKGTWLPSAQQRHFVVNCYPIQLSDGQTVGIGVVMLEITARKQAEQEREQLVFQLEAERARLEQVVQQMPVGVIIAAAPHGNLMLGNAQMAQILRHPFLPSSAIKEYTDYQGWYPDGRPYAP